MDALSRYLRPVPKSGGVWWLVSFLLIAGSVWGGVLLYRQHLVILQQKSELFRLQQQARIAPVPKPSRAQQEADEHWRNLRKELNYSWYPIFAALERTTNPDMALLEFLPDKGAATLTLHGNARDVNALTAYLDGLSAESTFNEVYLSHQKRVQQAGLNLIEFEIRLKSR